LFAGNSNRTLALEIAEHLGTSISDADVGKFADGETFVRYLVTC
jgi:ribose-phosphate pyrophosphokinase